LAVTENANVWNDDNNSMCITNSLIIFMVNPPKKFTLKGDGGNLIPYTLTLKATASAQKKPYQVKVRATLTTFKTLLQDEFIETAVSPVSSLRAVTSTE
jgi:hypothetical protein